MPDAICVVCACHNRPGLAHCTACGARLGPPVSGDLLAARFRTGQTHTLALPPRCPWCAAHTHAAARFCHACGTPQLPARAAA